jgi:hypothetical protein
MMYGQKNIKLYIDRRRIVTGVQLHVSAILKQHQAYHLYVKIAVDIHYQLPGRR